MNNLELWTERLSALHRNMMRHVASEAGLQLVHVEIMQYLAICNRYSDTTQALSDYLGQTKGSISQSLAFLEQHHFVQRIQDKKDKRVFHLIPTAKGSEFSEKIRKGFELDLDSTLKAEQIFKSVLTNLQKQNGMRSFGICTTCKHNQILEKNKSRCGLTEEILTKNDTQKICREHESP